MEGKYIPLHVPLHIAQNIYKYVFADCLYEIGKYQKLTKIYYVIEKILLKSIGKDINYLCDYQFDEDFHPPERNKSPIDFEYHYRYITYCFEKENMYVYIPKEYIENPFYDGRPCYPSYINPIHVVNLRKTCMNCYRVIIKCKNFKCIICNIVDNLNICSDCIKKHECQCMFLIGTVDIDW